MRRLGVALALSLGLFAGQQAVAAGAIGAVDRVQGECTGTRERGATVTLAAGSDIYLKETLATGAGARLAVSFSDGTKLTLSENASLILDTFVFQPEGQTTIAASIVGAFRYVSGKLAGGATRETTITTPVAVIGARGTDFWGGEIDSAFGVVVLEGSVTVTTPAGTTVLSAPGQGTSVTAPGTAPGPVVNWAQGKIDRAIATVTFQ